MAHWLLAGELGDRQGLTAEADAAEAVCRKLTHRLARLVTFAGCQALLVRALRLTSADYPFLEGIRPGSSPESCLEGLREGVEGLEPARAREGMAMVLASLLWLITTFIGDEITLRLVRDVWPDARIGGTGPGTREAQRA
ncbi:MAG TPA: hypothetical protein VML96_07775 [Egibacteraceae bacterium]|nr:hypothetical protein [Egibacteraceae bacterium]